jgi:D-alanyl-D-alanine carboxypeptidase/D-alanyl-D-alanine-endopeptidase (penicillin-binding protein 4)
VLGVLALGGLAACGGGGGLPRTVSTTRHTAATVHTAAVIPRALRSPPPGTQALRAALNRAFEKAGPGSGAAVYDLTDRVSLFSLRAGVQRPPASVEKLYTTVAVLDKVGPNATLKTTVLGTGHLGPGGVWHGDLYLRGAGDPTFGDATFNRIWEDGQGSTAAELSKQLEQDGIRRVTGPVIGDGSLFDPRTGPPSTGFAPDIPDLGGQLGALTYDHGATAKLTPPTFAARQLVLTMRAMGMKARATQRAGTTPATAQPLATVSSPPMSVLLRLMDVPSDDFFAEMLSKQLGAQFAGGGTTAAGAQVISNTLAQYGIHPRIVDGSGLSRSDRSSPNGVVDLLRSVNGTATGAGLSAALPTVGVSGTVRTIGVHTAAQGRCIAKTGTLDGVTNLAGYCHSRGNKLLAFALFIDGPPNWTALQLISQMVGAIARL